MVNSEKLSLMTKTEMLDKKYGGEYRLASHYYAYDYISMQVIKAAFLVTIGYALCLALWGVAHIEAIFDDNKVSALFALARDFIVIYVAVLLLTILLSSLIYASRYWKARKAMGGYVDSLRKLNQYYNKDSKRRR